MAASSFACQCLEKNQMVQTSLKSLEVKKKHITVIDSLIIISLFAGLQGRFPIRQQMSLFEIAGNKCVSVSVFYEAFSFHLTIDTVFKIDIFIRLCHILQALCTVALTSHVKVFFMKNKKTKYRLQ